MGAFHSKQAETFETDEPEKPLPPLKCKILAVDPRSPSDEIVRTPIQVEQSPQSSAFNKFLDPRSPSGLVRTPVFITENIKDLKKNDGIKMNNAGKPKKLFLNKNTFQVSSPKHVYTKPVPNKTTFDFPEDKENDPLLK